jgi:hypothetical protein
LIAGNEKIEDAIRTFYDRGLFDYFSPIQINIGAADDRLRKFRPVLSIGLSSA